MAIRVTYCSSEASEYISEMKMYLNSNDEIYIEIYDPDDSSRNQFICLDKNTAIRLAKDLRREISQIQRLD